jgi:hypothetical protein
MRIQFPSKISSQKAKKKLSNHGTKFLNFVCHFFKKLCSAFEEGAADPN